MEISSLGLQSFYLAVCTMGKHGIDGLKICLIFPLSLLESLFNTTGGGWMCHVYVTEVPDPEVCQSGGAIQVIWLCNIIRAYVQSTCQIPNSAQLKN